MNLYELLKPVKNRNNMNHKPNRWKKKMNKLYEEDHQKSIKDQIKSVMRSKGISEYFLEVVKNQEATDRFE